MPGSRQALCGTIQSDTQLDSKKRLGLMPAENTGTSVQIEGS